MNINKWKFEHFFTKLTLDVLECRVLVHIQKLVTKLQSSYKTNYPVFLPVIHHDLHKDTGSKQ